MYRSGRSTPSRGQASILEGDTLYVPPSVFSWMQMAARGGDEMVRLLMAFAITGKSTEQTAEGMQSYVEHRSDEWARNALAAAGLDWIAIKAREHRETKIVVDYEM